MPLRQPFSVLVVIYNTQDEFLLIRRADDAAFWQSVTGGIEPGETPLETAYRELHEETGIDARGLGLTLCDHKRTHQYEIRPAWRHRYEASARVNTEHVFSVCVPVHTEVTLDPNEHTDFIWLKRGLAVEKAWSPSNAEEILKV